MLEHLIFKRKEIKEEYGKTISDINNDTHEMNDMSVWLLSEFETLCKKKNIKEKEIILKEKNFMKLTTPDTSSECDDKEINEEIRDTINKNSNNEKNDQKEKKIRRKSNESSIIEKKSDGKDKKKKVYYIKKNI